jgi:lysyl-tRNA synthetase class II
VSGRISSIRKHGKTTFIDLRDEHVRLQVAVKTTTEDVPFRRGDVVAAKGQAFITKKG